MSTHQLQSSSPPSQNASNKMGPLLNNCCCNCYLPTSPQHSDDAATMQNCSLPGFTSIASDYSFILNCCNRSSPPNDKHHLCIRCFSQLSAERGCKSYLTCPQCKSHARSWRIEKIVRTTRTVEKEAEPCRRQLRSTKNRYAKHLVTIKNEEEERIHIATDCIDVPDIYFNPQEYHKNITRI